ncbi:hypothetical protein U9M48_018338 [Paspalum notatum var. saurae]|uniref:BHLH domain-containing protein n=1 Tax=Paspalum notatum var. saurae TaxID=547442 RepID=A0AAQ3WPP9_PASNO
MDHLADTLEEATVQQQQVVRERGRRIKAAAELGLARSSRGRALGARARGVVPPAGNKRRQARPRSAAPVEERGDDGQQEEEEEEVVEEKVALLRQLVPGGEGMPVDGLLEETVDYIAALEAQVGVMRALACLLSGSGSGLDDALALPEAEPAGILTTPEKPV